MYIYVCPVKSVCLSVCLCLCLLRNLANKEPCVGIEKLFIARYSEQPLSFFGGLVPIFMDFVDMFCANETSYKEALDSLAVG